MTDEIKAPEVAPTFKSLLTANSTKTVDFNGGKLVIQKLSLKKVFAIQALVKAMEGKEDDKNSINVLIEIIQSGVVGGESVTPEEIQTGNLDSLQILSNEIMAYSGMGTTMGNEISLKT